MRIPPRSLVKRHMKAHLPSNVRLSKNLDIYVYLSMLIYLKELASETKVSVQMEAAGIGLAPPLDSSKLIISKRHVRMARERVRS
ncbi:hypothetical protein IE53DRAFT_316140 [Violaceomyces palustris]|uniref:Uncharacterized protein n=1 Tax=Violaceomyces palustris TaxID=1673888 RepID=A0ACD0NWX5_9BASI|nr:hypothetical protein IE53DRAFT_316140 [Violaceomyces palustris]